MAHDPGSLDPEITAFLSERHLATLTVLRADGSPHVTPVGFTWDDDAKIARVITWSGARKISHLLSAETADPGAAAPRASVCQVDGGRWLTLEGTAEVTADPERCANGEQRYAVRYRTPKQRDDRRVIEIHVDRVMGRG